MTNEEYSQLAAKAAGVAIGSNGKPAFTSYEQSMKYAEALTNLHKSGINRNSTTQEIAAASVGATVGQNGRPNISSVSQGVGYGNALKNLKSNPQPNVNQNSSGAKSNATGSQNNTGNKANTNPTGSTKPSSSTSTSRSANSTSSSARLSNADYNRLAAQIVGVPVDRNGNPVCNSYEQYMQFGQTLSNLHNGGINANSTPHEIAAASVGAKNNTLNIFNPSQLMGYSKALVNLLKGTQQGVSYVDTTPTKAPPTSSEQTVGSDIDKVKYAVEILASEKTGIEIDSEGNPISKDPAVINKFYAERNKLMENKDKIMAAAAAGIPVNQNGEPIRQNACDDIAYKRAYELLFSTDSKIADVFDNDTILKDSIVVKDDRISTGIYVGTAYNIVESDMPSVTGSGTLTQAEKNYLIYMVLHEGGSIPIDCTDGEAQLTAMASTCLNSYEVQNDGTTFAQWIHDACTVYAEDNYTKNVLGNKLLNNDYSGLNFNGYSPEQIARAEEAVNTVLSGTRNINATGWRANGDYRNYFRKDTLNLPELEKIE